MVRVYPQEEVKGDIAQVICAYDQSTPQLTFDTCVNLNGSGRLKIRGSSSEQWSPSGDLVVEEARVEGFKTYGGRDRLIVVLKIGQRISRRANSYWFSRRTT